jgi:3-methyladenine DNA glycosylase AlkD
MTEQKLAPETIAKQAIAALKLKADPVRAAGAQKYFKETVKCYGLISPDVRAIAAGLYASIKKEWTGLDAAALCEILYREPYLESKSVGTIILARFRKDLPKTMFDRIKGWLAADLLDNWASVDTLCPDVMGALLARYPELVPRIKSWTGHPNRWVKRASAVSFLKLTRSEEYVDAIYWIATALFPVDDDLIHKAAGWLLREAGKRDMSRLERFLLEHGPAIPRTTLRYAIERYDEKKRKSLLAATR